MDHPLDHEKYVYGEEADQLDIFYFGKAYVVAACEEQAIIQLRFGLYWLSLEEAQRVLQEYNSLPTRMQDLRIFAVPLVESIFDCVI